LGIEAVIVLDELPLDLRHASKIDYVKLRQIVQQRSPSGFLGFKARMIEGGQGDR
jgi:hypothetical protein